GRAGLTRQGPLEAVPAEVEPTRCSGRMQGDLFALALPHIADPQIASLAVEAIAPRIAQPPVPDFAAGARLVGKGIGRRDCVRPAGANGNAQDLAQQRVDVLSRVVGIVAAAAITQTDVEVTIRPELE